MGNRRCLYCGVLETNSQKSYFYGFPKTPERRSKWKNILDIADQNLKSSSVICDRHFRADQKLVSRLKKKALPFATDSEIATQQTGSNGALSTKLTSSPLQSLKMNHKSPNTSGMALQGTAVAYPSHLVIQRPYGKMPSPNENSNPSHQLRTALQSLESTLLSPTISEMEMQGTAVAYPSPLVMHYTHVQMPSETENSNPSHHSHQSYTPLQTLKSTHLSPNTSGMALQGTAVAYPLHPMIQSPYRQMPSPNSSSNPELNTHLQPLKTVYSSPNTSGMALQGTAVVYPSPLLTKRPYEQILCNKENTPPTQKICRKILPKPSINLSNNPGSRTAMMYPTAAPRRIDTKDGKKAINLHKRLKKCQQSKLRLQLRLAKYKSLNQNLESIFQKNPSMKNIIMSQVKRYQSKKNQLYTEAEKSTAMTLYYSCGSKGYKTLLQTGFKLPSVSTIQFWLTKFEFEVGINQQLIEAVKEKVDGLKQEEKECILVWDEVSVKELLEYDKNKDRLTGIADLGKGLRKLELATECLVFMVQGLYGEWKLPFSYYFSSSSTTTEKLKTIVMENITTVLSLGLSLRGCVCDMGFCNQGLYRAWKISPAKPFIIVENNKIFMVFDIPHLIKLIRNNLMKYNFVIGKGKKKKFIKWLYINQFARKDRNCTLRMAPKLTDGHLYVKDYSKMKVKLAVQLLSHSVHSGMMTMIKRKRLNVLAKPTAIFVKDVDTLFDLCNISKMTDPKSVKCANKIFENVCLFDKYINLVKSIEIPRAKEGRPDFLKGLEITLTGIKMIIEDLKSSRYQKVYTRKIQQDCCENFFSLIRSKGGWCKNPTARQFRENFRFLVFNTTLKVSKYANCENASLTSLITLSDMTKLISSKQALSENINNSLNSKPCQRLELAHFDTVENLLQIERSQGENVGNITGVAAQGTELACPFGVSDEAENVNVIMQSSGCNPDTNFFSEFKSRKEKEAKTDEHNKMVAMYVGSFCIKNNLGKTDCRHCKSMLYKSSLSSKNELLCFEKAYAIHGNPNKLDFKTVMTPNNLDVFFYVAKSFHVVLNKTLNYKGVKLIENMLTFYNSIPLVKHWLEHGRCEHRKNILAKYLRIILFRKVKDKNDSVKQSKSWNQTRRELRNQ